MEETEITEQQRMGMTDAQWEIYQRATSGYGEQSESGVDISLIRENLKLSPTQRIEKMRVSLSLVMEVQNAGINAGLSFRTSRA